MKTPINIEFHNKSRVMDIAFEDASYSMTYEFLRVFSPSAEVRGHVPEEAKLQVGKRDIGIAEVKPIGEYALQIIFSDGHDSGIYSWDWLEEIGKNQEALWQGYLKDLEEAGASRDPEDPANVPFLEKEKRPTCPSHH